MNKVLKALQARITPREENEKGFTLIELLVVVLIIGILSAIAIPIFLNQQASARSSAAQSDVTNAKVALVAYIVANPTLPFPTDVALLKADFTPAADSNIKIQGSQAQFCISGWNTQNATTAGKKGQDYAASDKSGTVLGACAADGTMSPDPATP